MSPLSRGHPADGSLSGWEISTRRIAPSRAGLSGDLGAHREAAPMVARRQEIPQAGLALIINLGDPMHIADASGRKLAIPAGGGAVAGMSQTRGITTSTGRQEGVRIWLSPLAAYRLLQRPMAEFAHRAVLLDDVAACLPPDLAARLAETASVAGRLGMV